MIQPDQVGTPAARGRPPKSCSSKTTPAMSGWSGKNWPHVLIPQAHLQFLPACCLLMGPF